MNERPTLPYGSWPSLIGTEMAVGSARGLSEPIPDGADVYLLESRPEEAGRVVLLRRTPDGLVTDMAPGLNVRTRVHEYGGGAYTVRDGCLVFSEFVDNRLMLKRTPDATPVTLVADPALRFADLELDLPRDRVIAVMEDQRESVIGARNLICAVSLADGAIIELTTGRDFYSDPRLSPDGRQLAWLSWEFPQMPWDGTDLWVGSVRDDGKLGTAVHIAGGTEESITQPRWAPDGSLVFVSDRTGWSNLYRWRQGVTKVEALEPMEAEFAGPQWVFGLSDHGIDADGTVVASSFAMGDVRLWAVAPEGAAPRDLGVSADEIDYLRVRDGVVTFIGAFATRPRALMSLDLNTGHLERLHEASRLTVEPAYLSTPRHVAFPTSGGRTAYAWYYPPANPDVRGPTDEAPPLVVMTHGGPTSQASAALSLERQAFTSRGFAVVDVDYGGSTGYGRAFRDQLREQWGVVDVDDCTTAALWLAEQGLADRRRLAIRGGSAGGYTTLAALCFRDVFTAGTSFYGLGDLEAFTEITHKFESRYMDILVGPYPEQAERYRERSPDRHADRMSCPVLVMQGADDKIVPPSQAEGIVAALARNGLPHAYLLFEGEGHGFRQAVNRQQALEAELSFYAQVWGFELAGDIPRLEVVGLPIR
jgi:dienelactone hydrolase